MAKARNIKMILSYDGSSFMGWQAQPGQRTVQSTVEDVLKIIFDEQIRINAAGRTDAGVHAFGQVAAFSTLSSITTGALQKAINSLLPDDISIISVEDAPEEFHPRYSAKSKTYLYAIDTSSVRNPFFSRYALHARHRLDIESMMQSTGYFIGEHDFASFMGAGTPVKSTVRTISASEITVRGSMVYYTIRGSGFLRHMVRNIVGTLVEVGKGKIPIDGIDEIIKAKDRSMAGPTAPPQGLYLVNVKY
jgi:tRNA pseudouridine38-40 synthase